MIDNYESLKQKIMSLPYEKIKFIFDNYQSIVAKWEYWNDITELYEEENKRDLSNSQENIVNKKSACGYISDKTISDYTDSDEENEVDANVINNTDVNVHTKSSSEQEKIPTLKWDGD